MLTILLVDDDPEEFELFSTAINSIDKRVNLIHADDCVDLLATIEKHRPDIVFLDINMPFLNGIECLKNVRSAKRFESLPIVMYSTSNSRLNIQQSFENKADLYIVKPQSFKGIITALEKVLKIDWQISRRPALNDFVLA